VFAKCCSGELIHALDVIVDVQHAMELGLNDFEPVKIFNRF
jgi:hypothetical protein